MALARIFPDPTIKLEEIRLLNQEEMEKCIDRTKEIEYDPF